MGSDRSWEDLLDMTSNKPEATDRRRLFLGVGVLAHLHGFPRPRASVRLVLSPGTRGRSNPFIR